MFPDVTGETIEVRPDERFDEEALARYLEGKLGGAADRPTVRQFGGGAANLTYELDYGDEVYVLRRPPLGPVAATAHDMGREHRVLSSLGVAYPPAPRSLLFCADESVIGAPFIVMERRYGVVVRRQMPGQFADRADAARRMSEALVDALADLHQVDYGAIGLEDLGKPAGFIRRQVEGWRRRWDEAKESDLEDMDIVHRWLDANLPAGGAASLVHNDYKLDNAMFEPSDPSRLVAVLDWDMCTLGDPLSDLGALLTYWSEPTDSPEEQSVSPMPAGEHGFLAREEVVDRYARRSGRNVADIDFYHVLGRYRLAVILAQIYLRWRRGQTRDERFAGLGKRIEVVAKTARKIAGV